MCGLFGHSNASPHELERSRSALHSLTHRGPDQWGEWTGDNLYMGHRRLSILDLSDAGKQPMVSEDGQVILTANGEIYNFRELRQELEGHYTFKSNSDSETLLHGYRHWGIDGLLARLDGMFAFAIYDRNEQILYLARDHVGIKPLYYGTLGTGIIWASELKAIMAYAEENQLQPDPEALYDFLTYLYIPAPKSLYKNIHKLPPAHYAAIGVKSGSIRTQRYWTLEANPDQALSLSDAEEKTRHVIRQAVGSQMIADVPVGFFLSGGMDSSVVVAEAAGLTPSPHTFTIGFDDTGRDESPYAKEVAELFSTDHTIRYFEKDNSQENLSQLKEWYDEPHGDTSAFPSWHVAKLARESVTVVLTGDGGDEVFGGYKWYDSVPHFLKFRQPWLAFMQPHLRTVRQNYGATNMLGKLAGRADCYLYNDPFGLYAKLMGGLAKEHKQRYAHAYGIPADYDDYWAFRQHWREELPLITRLQYMDFHTYLPDDILTKVDRVTMAVSLESRVPLLAKEVVETLFNTPEPIRLHNSRNSSPMLKGLMKYAYRDMLPDHILHRPKRGFSVPPGKLDALKQSHTRSLGEVLLESLYPYLYPDG